MNPEEIEINLENHIASDPHITRIFKPIEGENLKSFELSVQNNSRSTNYLMHMLEHGLQEQYFRQSTMRRQDTYRNSVSPSI